ncbi:ubiquinol-cytochrome C chaperone family protein [Arvimicrobium flavum]|uniref:ubiquinol-cytochrome C chaperone family protein n=1 Tax=Arvimicrobium flavum TaxID=3393320 RepID=UPI00237BF252|nr:ubiquinol-cytochrome C chaperone family protein [Mesorhizobium shangrilense]
MFQRWFGRNRHANRAVTDALYERIVAAARQPVFYAEWDVPDTPLGRFEMVGLHVFLFLHRVRGEQGTIAEIAQTLTDEFFADVDSSLRELGIGDAGVPKRAKKLAKMFYGRAASYGDALDRGDREALAAALGRNVRPDLDGWAGAGPLSDYVTSVAASLRAQDSEEFLAGRIALPAAGKAEQ